MPTLTRQSSRIGRNLPLWRFPRENSSKTRWSRDGTARSFPKAQHGLTIIAKIEPGREEVIRAYGKTIEETIAGAQLLVPYNAFLLSVPKSGFCFLWGKCGVR